MPLGKNLKSRKDLHDTLKRIQDLGAVSVACYENIPYLEQNPKTINDLDAIETWNAEANLWLPGITQRKANKKAQEFYNEFKKDFPHLGKIISSDGHSLYEIGKTHMEIDFPDLSSMHNLNESLKKSFREQKKEQKNNLIGILGATHHAFSLAKIIAQEKIGMSKEQPITKIETV